jgi:Ca2+:H+ antiporter
MVFTLLLLFVPLSLALSYFFHAGPMWVFGSAILGIVPLAEWIRRATEQLAKRAGPAIGGLLNVTFGNTAELILALFVLASGHPNVVKGQITGSIIGNSLLGLGLCAVVAGWGRARQSFPRERAGILSSLLILSTIALLLPALFDYTERGLYKSPDPGGLDEALSLGVSVILILVYVLNLVRTLVARQDVFEFEEKGACGVWPVWRSLAVLGLATAVTAWEAELVSGALEATAAQLGFSPFFLGVVVLAVIGNASEYVTSIYFARTGRMGMALAITVGSSIQVALLLAPVVVIVSNLLGNPMNLVFSNPLELIAIAGAAFAVNAIAQDGETTWFEGVLLLAVYALFALAFFFVTPPP